MRRFALILVAVSCAILALIQAPAFAYLPRILRIGFVPSENSQEMTRQVGPLIERLHRVLHMNVTAFIPTDYPGVIEAMRSHMIDAAFLSPGAFVLAERDSLRRHRPFFIRPLLKTVRHGGDVYYSAIIVRADSGIHSLSQLKGKRFAFGDPESMAGTLFAKVLLKKAGMDPERDFTLLPPGGHDTTVLAVFNRLADAGAVFADDKQGKVGAWTIFLKSPAEQRQIRAIAYSLPIPNDMFCVRSDLAPSLARNLAGTLAGLARTPSGRHLLHRVYDIDGFSIAHSSDYDPVREAVAH